MSPAQKPGPPKQEILASHESGRSLIGRIWRGRTRADRADEYQAYLYPEGVLTIEAKPGCLGAQMFRATKGDVTEFTVISYWESMEAMRAMHSDRTDVLRVAHLKRDPEFLLELPEFVELTELHVNDWQQDGRVGA
jgi:heme-degrading monooxygenase HmoA